MFSGRVVYSSEVSNAFILSVNQSKLSVVTPIKLEDERTKLPKRL